MTFLLTMAQRFFYEINGRVDGSIYATHRYDTRILNIGSRQQGKNCRLS
jgi:hypothetical protein